MEQDAGLETLVATSVRTPKAQEDEAPKALSLKGWTRGSEAKSKASDGGGAQTSTGPRSRTIFLTSAGRIKKCDWTGLTWDDLEKLHREAFYEYDGRAIPTEPKAKLNRNSFALRDREFGIFYEDFEIGEIYKGCVIEVNDPFLMLEYNELSGHIVPSSLQGKDVVKRTLEAEGPVSEPSIEHSSEPAPSISQPEDDEEDEEDEVDPATLTLRQKLWKLLDDPTSSKPAAAITIFVLILILFSTCTFCLETLPVFYVDNPDTTSIWWIMEAVNISVFTFEFLLRVISCPDISQYFRETMNIVDIIAILPFYMEIILSSVEIPGLAVFRVVRLVRVFRLFKVSRGAISVFGATMQQSARPLYMLVFFTSIAMILFSSLIYYAERGVYDEELELWMRLDHYECSILIRTEAEVKGGLPPPISPDFEVDSGHEVGCRYDPNQPEGLQDFEAYFICPFSWRKNSQCSKVYTQTPFESIPAAFWWCLVSMTTVGYGDMYPTQWYGKILGMVVMMFGILVIALPITVIGSNFAVVYKRVVMHEIYKKQAAQRSKLAEENGKKKKSAKTRQSIGDVVAVTDLLQSAVEKVGTTKEEKTDQTGEKI